MNVAKLTSKGQMTVPIKVRRALGLREGDLVRFDVREERAVLSKLTTGDEAYLKGVEGTLTEWLSESDEKAYRDL